MDYYLEYESGISGITDPLSDSFGNENNMEQYNFILLKPNYFPENSLAIENVLNFEFNKPNRSKILIVERIESKTFTFLRKKKTRSNIQSKTRVNTSDNKTIDKSSDKETKTNNKKSTRKYDDDNIVLKIKTHLDKYFHDLINQIIEDESLKLTKLCTDNRQDGKKDFNLEFLDTSLKDIYLNTKESTKPKKKYFDSNETKIKNIYASKKEK